MSKASVAAYTIGQTPRPDLTEGLSARFDSVSFDLVGALDGLDPGEIPPCPQRGYPLETRLRDGTQVVVDAAFVAPLLQQAMTARDPGVAAHLVLCAGPFPGLVSPVPVIRPFDVAVATLTARRLRHLDVVVPFAEQASPALDKWGAAGFGCRALVMAERPGHRSVAEWIAGLVRRTRAQALVFDYVGLPALTFDEVADAVSLPLYDLGRMGLDALERTLATP